MTPLHIQEGAATPWRAWFAWLPTLLSEPVAPNHYLPRGGWTWLRWVERRRFYAAPWFVISHWDEFRLPGTRDCTCHPKDNPPWPCQKRYAYSECVAASRSLTSAVRE